MGPPCRRPRRARPTAAAVAVLAAGLLATGLGARWGARCFAAGARRAAWAPAAPRGAAPGAAPRTARRAAAAARALEMGAELAGKVTELGDDGAWLDLGLDVPGYLSFDQMREEDGEDTSKPEDKLKVGQSVPVWVYRVLKRQVDVHGFKPEATLGQELVGSVVKATKDTLLLDVGLGVPAKMTRTFAQKATTGYGDYFHQRYGLRDKVTVWVQEISATGIRVRGFQGGLAVGAELDGTVVGVNEKGAGVDVKQYALGFIPARELTMDDKTGPEDVVTAGDKVKVFVKDVLPGSVELVLAGA